ncbi:MAG TPA: J domain-containing protein [Candidatus Limnocylindrales bacterium]|nr:J domain-containing protein [Candidatus Limnocylindrales bacterium]
MPKWDPHDVLGVPRNASQATIKAAWRKLAREHHPDLTGGDSQAARAATRRMAEINQAYEQLRIGRLGQGNGTEAAATRRRWPPAEKPTRPVTGRLDTSGTFRPRNTTTGPAHRPAGRPPIRVDRLDREPLRASHPTGPLNRSRQRNFSPPPPPSLDDALALTIAFGKFHGHTLGEIASFEPSYIDWLARTIARDPELVAAARVVQEDLDRRSVARRPRPVGA